MAARRAAQKSESIERSSMIEGQTISRSTELRGIFPEVIIIGQPCSVISLLFTMSRLAELDLSETVLWGPCGGAICF